MLVFILLLAFCGACKSCNQTVQVCHKCKGGTSICNDGPSFDSTEEDCASYVMSNPSTLSAYYNEFYSNCYPFTCANNINHAFKWESIIRKTCNNDCTHFTLEIHFWKRVDEVALTSTSKSIGQCFEDCFETAGCYALSFSSGLCSIYTSCGTSCSMVTDYGTTAYTRTCHDEADCGQLNNPLNGTVDTSAGTSYNNLATYTCFTGYILAGTSPRTCQADGQWSGSQPVCNVDCGPLTSPPNGVVDTSSGTTYLYKASYTCSNGYIITGNSSRICQSNGQWSGFEPSCTIVDCGNMSAPDNGRVQNPANTTHLELATFSCFAGFNLTGSNQRTCQQSGSWSGTSPICNPVDCGIPTPPNNGAVVAINGTTYGQNVTFSCNTNYKLNGLAVTECNANGFWGTSPSCSYIGAPTPGPIVLYLAPCICYSNKVFTNMTQKEIIDHLIKETKIEKNSTALARRKLECAKDPRLSSKLVGYAGVAIITGTAVFMLLFDVLTFYRWWDERRRAGL